MKKIFWASNWVRRSFCHFFKVASLVSLDIVQDCSLGQCRTSNLNLKKKKKKKKKKGCGQNWGRNFNVTEHLLKLACFV